MQRRRAAKGNERASFKVLATLDRMHARSIRHVLLDDLAHAERSFQPLETERRANRSVDSHARALRIELDGATREIVGTEPAKYHIAVGYGRHVSP